MSSTINASTASGGGVITSADASGILQLQTAGVTGITIDTSQNVTFANPPAIVGTNITGTSNSLNAGIGVNQTVQDVTASRSLGTTYYNTTGKPIFIWVYTTYTANGISNLTINGIVLAYAALVITVGGSGHGTLYGIVPPGGTYLATNVSAATLVRWSELR
jgi:hypothetical protein